MIHFFARKTLALCALTLLVLLATVLLGSGTSRAYAATSSASVVSQDMTHNNQVVAPAATIYGCPDGYACIYPENAGWNNGVPSLTYYYYGVYQLSNQYGYHYVYNHQTGGALIRLCTDWYGNVCPITIRAGFYQNVDLTPINSVRLLA